MKFFRTFGQGTSLRQAFSQSSVYEDSYHKDLSKKFKNLTPISIELPDKISASELERRIIVADLANKAENMRALTGYEEKSKRWFYDNYGDNADYYLSCYNNKDKNCLAIKVTYLENFQFKKDNKTFGKPGKVWRFIGHEDYEFTDLDDY
jgi:hypothetical protein